MDNLVMAANSPPPQADGIALESAVEFFNGARSGQIIAKTTVRHGLWFSYTVNEARPESQEVLASLPAPEDGTVEEIAERGLELCEQARMKQPAEGAAAAVNFLLIMQIVQMVLQILSKLPRFGGGDGGNVI